VIGYGTGKAADLNRPNGAAGKTGTSENYSDAWFVGYTPELSTSVWMGFSDGQRPLVNIKGLPRVFGGTIPAKTWHDYMAAALAGVPATDFAVPAKPLPPAAPPPQMISPPVAPPATEPAGTFAPPVPPYPVPPTDGVPAGSPLGTDPPPGTPFYPVSPTVPPVAPPVPVPVPPSPLQGLLGTRR
jgi:penicillin-binding protein 1A